MVSISFDGIELKIEMLGGFTIVSDDILVKDRVKKSSKIWKLIQYLIVYRHKTVPQDELIDVFCNDENTSDPKSALRTMIYRARSALAESGLPCGEDLILSVGGGYRWNDSVKCIVDAEQFETLLKEACTEDEREKRLELILQAAGFYHGDFLPNSSGELWAMPLERWYRTSFVNSVYEALGMLMETGRNEEAEKLCVKALRADPFDESILEYHLRAMMAQGKSAEALEEYKKVEAMFYDVLGVSFSNNLRSLYNRIRSPDISEDMSLDFVLDDWLTGADFPGAYYCDINILKSVYQIEARSALRSGRTAFIVRFDMKRDPGVDDGGVMKQLGQVIPMNLRKGDLFTRSGVGQYMLMLNSLTYGNCRMLVDRIINSLDEKNQKKAIETSIMPVRPLA